MTSSLQDGGTVATLYEFLWVLVNTNRVEFDPLIISRTGERIEGFSASSWPVHLPLEKGRSISGRDTYAGLLLGSG